MINLIYYNAELRCYRTGKVERFFRNKGWKIVENTDNNKGYNHININKTLILRHRLIAYCFLGLDNIVGNQEKTNVIDHIDHNRINNCVENLRITTQYGNQQNRKNVKGYCFNKKINKYQAYIMVNGKKINLGYYIIEEDAKNARLKGEEKYHKNGVYKGFPLTFTKL